MKLCTCQRCVDLGNLAIRLAMAGAVDAGNAVAAMVTIVDDNGVAMTIGESFDAAPYGTLPTDSTEGYRDTWAPEEQAFFRAPLGEMN